MKIRRDQFKALIKECLQEIIAEGGINLAGSVLVPEQVNPYAKALASQTKNPNMMEKIFTDTAANSLPEHLAGDMQYPYNPQLNQAYGPPQNMVHVPQLNQQIYPQQYPIQHQNPAASASPWARLAFNSPIRNRPGNDSGTGNFLPGQNTGKFG